MPIVDEVNAVLFDGKSPAEAVNDLMMRESRSENRALSGKNKKSYPRILRHTLYQQSKGGIIMDSFQVYRICRCANGGEIYIGIVRTGADRKVHIYQKIHGSARASEYDRQPCKNADKG